MFSYFIDEFFALFKRVLCICEGFYFTIENLNMSLDEWGSGLCMKDGQTLYLNVCVHFLMSLTIFITILTDW